MAKTYLVLLLLFVGMVSAAGDSPQVNINLDLGPIIHSITDLPGQITNSLISTFTDGFSYAINEFTSAAFGFITASPDPNWFCQAYQNVMAVIESLYSLAFVGLGLFYVIKSTDIHGRILAKEWFKDLIFMIVLLSFSFKLFEILLAINSYLTTSFIGNATHDLFTVGGGFASIIFGFIVLSAGTIIVWLAFMTILARYILIPFLLLLFPIAIFLYFIPFTKDWGTAFLKLIVTVIFMSSIDALLVLAFSTLFNIGDPNLASDFIRTMAVLLGFSLIGVLNAILFVTSLFSIFGAATKSIGPLRYAIAGIIGKVLL